MKVDPMVLVRHCWDFDEGFRSTFIFHLTLISCSRGHIWNLNEGFWSKFICHIQTNRTCRGYRVLYIIHVTLLHQYHTPMTISSKFSVIFGFLWHHLHFISFSFILSRFWLKLKALFYYTGIKLWTWWYSDIHLSLFVFSLLLMICSSALSSCLFFFFYLLTSTFLHILLL